MNNSSEISTHESNSGHFFFNGTNMETDFEMSSVVYIICVLFGLPTNSYVIWLIVTGTGNGLAAESFILDHSVCEVIVCLESLLIFLNYNYNISWVLVRFLEGLIIIGHPLFQCLICVERYLAVVHPVTFLKYKPLRYRLICSGVAWVATFASGGVNVMIWLFIYELYLYFLMVPFLVFFFIQLFCCVAVLRALKQSGPGERGREREEGNHMKRRAFNLILITMVTTVIIYMPGIMVLFLPAADDFKNESRLCISQFSFVLAGLVQPVLFLYRVEKLNFIKCQ